jgi:hypothetical protein
MAQVFITLLWGETNKGVAFDAINTLKNIEGRHKSIVLEESNSGHESLSQPPLRVLIAQIGVIIRGTWYQT